MLCVSALAEESRASYTESQDAHRPKESVMTNSDKDREDRRSEEHREYADYRKRVPMLIPWFSVRGGPSVPQTETT
jgi:hypothetical protein